MLRSRSGFLARRTQDTVTQTQNLAHPGVFEGFARRRIETSERSPETIVILLRSGSRIATTFVCRSELQLHGDISHGGYFTPGRR